MNVTWVSLGVFGVTIILSVKSGQAFTVSQDHPPYLQALLPSPIVESTLDEYCTWVNASDAQRLAIRSYHDSYLQTYESVRNEVLERLKAPCELIHMSSLPHPDDLRHVVGITQRAIGELSAMDNRFLFQFREIMSEGQLPLHNHVFYDRQRAFYDIESLNHLPEIRVDLFRMYLASRESIPDQSRQLLLDYQRQEAALCHKRRDEVEKFLLHIADEIALFYDDYVKSMSDSSIPRLGVGRWMEQLQVELGQKIMKVNLSIAESTRRSFTHLTMGSAGNYGEIPDEFSHSYRHAVYPQLYSASFADDAFIHEIQTTFDTELDRIKSLETTHPEVSDLLRSYLSELATLRRRYESEYDDHRRRQAWPLFGHGVDHGDSTQSNLDVDAMRARIAALCSKYIGLLESKFNTSLTGPSRDPQEKTP